MLVRLLLLLQGMLVELQEVVMAVEMESMMSTENVEGR